MIHALAASILAAFLTFASTAAAGEWESGDTTMVNVFCVAEESLTALGEMYEEDPAAGRRHFSEQMRKGLCFTVKEPLAFTLAEPIKTYDLFGVPHKATVWSGNIRHIPDAYVLLIDGNRPPRGQEI